LGEKIVKIGPVDPNIAILLNLTRNAWQSLAYIPLGAVVLPPANVEERQNHGNWFRCFEDVGLSRRYEPSDVVE